MTILSGKGGTGKTSVTAALAFFAKNAVFTDCDVDAADLHLLFAPSVQEKHDFESGSKAEIDPERCTGCGICQEACRFDAISRTEDGLFQVNTLHCEGCRLCERLCPVSAITSLRSMNNQWFVSESRFGPFVHARMGPGEENSGKLVTRVRERAREIAKNGAYDIVINDGPPGIGCPVIASLAGIQQLLLVTEASSSGYQDLLRVIDLIGKYDLEVFGIINKYDINPEISDMIEKVFENHNIQMAGKIPFDKAFVEAMIHGKTIPEYSPDSVVTTIIENAWKVISSSPKTQA